jgi:dTDP-L-rhamnose 4-epimerase
MVFDVGYGLPSTIKDLAHEVARHYGAPAPHVCGKYRNGDVRHAGCDVTPTLELGWAPQVTMAQGVASLCDWIDARLEGEVR